ncbi:MAG: biopolymer transporter ExbD [Chitinophagales bacterium]
MQRTTSRKPNEINASSMADIAFLLLIFFLVTTTMDVDKGLLTLLPPYEVGENNAPVNDRNVLQILVNAKDELLVEGEPIHIRDLKEISKIHINNYGKNPKYSDAPDEAVISLKNDRGTSYERYVEVHNEIRAAYSELRNEYSERKFGLDYKELGENQQKEVRQEYPLRLSEAEPEDFGGVGTE